MVRKFCRAAILLALLASACFATLPQQASAKRFRITERPPSQSVSTAASFSWRASHRAKHSACSLDGHRFKRCESPQTYRHLQLGKHGFRVRIASGRTKHVRWWVMPRSRSTGVLSVSITSSPPSSTTATSATFTWATSQGSKARCALDGGAYVSCSSPRTYTGLSPATHSFTVSVSRLKQTVSASRTWTVVASAPAPSPSPSSPPPPSPTPSSNGVYWGVWTGKHLTGTEAPWDMGAITKFESLIGSSSSSNRTMSIVKYGSNLNYGFNAAAMNNIVNHGSIPALQFAFGGTSNRDAALGAVDAKILTWAAAAKAWGKPFFLMLNPEVNGSCWYYWTICGTASTATDYVSAWRHAHDLVKLAGATNVTWTWCPNVDVNGTMPPLEGAYPGDAYVDWTCMDGYNWGAARSDLWRPFHDLFASTYARLTALAPSKPVILGEMASNDAVGDKTQWFRDMFTSLPRDFPNVRAFVWFERDPCETEPAPCGRFPVEWGGDPLVFGSLVADQRYVKAGATPTAGPIPAP
jgi:hypothetical protein